MFNTLINIGEKLNDANITWAVGASLMLNQFGLIDKPNDIDIFIKLEDIEKADSILKDMGEKKKFKNTSTYSTKYFYEYVINKIDVDVMSGLAINHDEGVFKYIFDTNSITNFKIINGISIPFTSLEDWYVLYQLIPNRQSKVKLIENYLLSHEINKTLLERSLKECLPIDVRKKIENIINSF